VLRGCRRRGCAARIDEDLGVYVGGAERAERSLDPIESHRPGDEPSGVDDAVGEHVKGVSKRERCVAEHEISPTAPAMKPSSDTPIE
jgi:hypothetical protein